MVSGPPHSFTWTAIIYFSNIYWAPCMCQRLAMSKKQCHCSHGSFILVVEGNKCISKWCHIMTYAVKNIKQVNGIVKVGNRGLLYDGWWVKGTPRGWHLSWDLNCEEEADVWRLKGQVPGAGGTTGARHTCHAWKKKEDACNWQVVSRGESGRWWGQEKPAGRGQKFRFHSYCFFQPIGKKRLGLEKQC